MGNKQLPQSDYQIFSLKILLWLATGWVAYLLTLTGFFYAPIVWVFFGLGAVLVWKIAAQKNLLDSISKELWLVTGLVLAGVIFFSFFTTPTVFSGRDQGSISEAAIRLAQNHQLEFSTPASQEFFKLNKPGRALNFPGFYYTQEGNLKTQFPLAYIAWLATFYAAFGITGFIVANAILWILFLLSFYLLVRIFVPSGPALLALLFNFTSFGMFWFRKYTLSENMATPLVWIAVLSLILFLKQRKGLYYASLLAATFLLCFTRVEGLGILVAIMLILFFNQNARQYLTAKFQLKFLLPMSAFLLVFIINAVQDFYFYKEIIKALLPKVSLPQAKYLGQIANATLPDFYLWKTFFLYGLFGFFVLGTIAVVILLFKRRVLLLIPLLVISPTLIYFFGAHISSDHPWMLRRFVFTLLPAAIFYTVILLSFWHQHLKNNHKSIQARLLPNFLVLLLLISTWPAFSNFALFSENKKLLEQTAKLGATFPENSLILIDREAGGDGWNMLPGPLGAIYGKNAAYFFNNQDLSHLNLQRFEATYLIVPEKKVSFYLNSTISERLTEFERYSLETQRLTNQLDIPGEILRLPQKENLTLRGTVFLVK